jgi:hypothetical protein
VRSTGKAGATGARYITDENRRSTADSITLLSPSNEAVIRIDAAAVGIGVRAFELDGEITYECNAVRSVT